MRRGRLLPRPLPCRHVGTIARISTTLAITDRTRERNRLLETLNDVGVALSGSFDIKEILWRTHQAASMLTGRTPQGSVEVVYFGCTINSRPRWYRGAGVGPASMPAKGDRRALQRALRRRSHRSPGKAAGSASAELSRGASRPLFVSPATSRASTPRGSSRS